MFYGKNIYEAFKVLAKREANEKAPEEASYPFPGDAIFLCLDPCTVLYYTSLLLFLWCSKFPETIPCIKISRAIGKLFMLLCGAVDFQRRFHALWSSGQSPSCSCCCRIFVHCGHHACGLAAPLCAMSLASYLMGSFEKSVQASVQLFTSSWGMN